MDIQIIKSALEAEGFRPTLDQDGDILFKFEGRTYFIEADADDPKYVRIVFPNFWPIESEEERQKATHVAHDTTGSVKVAKIYLVNDNVWCSAELFLPDEAAFSAVLMRTMNVVQHGADEFASTMKKTA